MGNPIRFVYCTKEEFLKYIEEEKAAKASSETSNEESSETIEKHSN